MQSRHQQTNHEESRPVRTESGDPHHMNRSGNTWAIVLAAGEGRRLQSLTMTESGVAIPKQFCSLRGGDSLLRETLIRAKAIARSENICIVVARQHSQWWSIELQSELTTNIIVQPRNCGTAVGILLPLLHIWARDPDARIVLLPSDHNVRDESILARALKRMLHELEAKRDKIFLLGISPEHADPELGYIVPGGADKSGVSIVSRFVEKPSAPLARSLIGAGALWNALIVSTYLQTLLQAFAQRFPRIVAEMQAAVGQTPFTADSPDTVADLYQRLPDLDFSRQILQNSESILRVLRVDSCGWSDLGTPKRVAETLLQLRRLDNVADHPLDRRSGFLSLAAQHGRLQTGGFPH
jgi:mannose-1-phosphate guanylyltransferase